MNTKMRILETAIKLFVDHGYENTPTSKISEESKVATGTLFHHFESKKTIINQAYLYVAKKMMMNLKQFEFRDLKSYLLEIWINGMKWSLENKYYVKFMLNFANSTYISKGTLTNAENILRPYYSLMSDRLNGDIIKDLPRGIHINIYNRIFEIFFLHMCETNPKNDDLIEKGFSVVWDALTSIDQYPGK